MTNGKIKLLNESIDWADGEDFLFNNGSLLKNMKLRTVKKYGESNYNLLVKIFSQKVFDMSLELFKVGVDYEEVDDYALFVMMMVSYYFIEEKSIEDRKFYDLVNLFLSCNDMLLRMQDNGDVYFIDSVDNRTIIDKEIYLVMSSTTTEISCFKTEKKMKFENNFSKRKYFENLIEELEDEDMSNNKKMTIGSLATAIVLETNYTYDTVMDINIYNFHLLVHAITKREEWNGIMIGIYTGNIDTKKINLSNYNWLLR